MSAGSYTGSIAVESIGTVYFSTSPTDRGRVPTGLQVIVEELMANGADGRRWRDVYKQYPPFQMRTTADGPTWTDGLLNADLYEKMVGAFCTLTVITGGITFTWKNTKILGCQPMLNAGILVGFGADAASSYILDATWALVITQVAS